MEVLCLIKNTWDIIFIAWACFIRSSEPHPTRRSRLPPRPHRGHRPSPFTLRDFARRRLRLEDIAVEVPQREAIAMEEQASAGRPTAGRLAAIGLFGLMNRMDPHKHVKGG